jgi:hypothetical protein
MFPKQEIDGFEKYWRQRKLGSITVVHHSSDLHLFQMASGGFSP